jgi:hypothetical protein
VITATNPPAASRRWVKTALACLAVLALLRAFVAEAASGASVTSRPTWGTATASGSASTSSTSSEKVRAQLVLAIAEAGDRVILGGEFKKMRDPASGTSQTRNRLAALDVNTGALLPWNPNADGRVRDMVLSADMTKLYLGGDFNNIGGKSARKLAAINLATGKLDPAFKPKVRSRVRGLALHGNRLYVGGDFETIDGAPRSKLAAFDATTGALLPWAAPAIGPGRYMGQTGIPTPEEESGDVYTLAVPADGSRVYAGGNFIDFAGQGGLIALDAVTGQPFPEQWEVERPVFDLTMWPGDGWTLFAATGGPGGRLFAFRPDKMNRPIWKAKVDGDAMGVAASTNTVFLAGHFDFVVNKDSSCYQFCPEGLERRHLAAFDALTGVADPWNPVADTHTGPYVAAAGARHVYAGGEFNRINGQPQPGFAQFEMLPAPPVSTTTTTAGPTTTTTAPTTSSTVAGETTTTVTTAPTTSSTVAGETTTTVTTAPTTSTTVAEATTTTVTTAPTTSTTASTTTTEPTTPTTGAHQPTSWWSW